MKKNNLIALFMVFLFSLPFTNGGCNSSSSGDDGETLAVSIMMPDDNDQISGFQTISTEITSDDGVDRVEYYLWWRGEDSPLPEWIDNKGQTGSGTWTYEQSWDTANYPDGEYSLQVIAYDLIGSSAEDEITVTTNNGNNALTVYITGPIDGDIITGSLTISSDIISSNGIDRVEFYIPYEQPWLFGIDDSDRTGSGTWTYEQSFPLVCDGGQYVQVVAYDLIGSSAEDEVFFTTINGNHCLEAHPNELYISASENFADFCLLSLSWTKFHIEIPNEWPEGFIDVNRDVGLIPDICLNNPVSIDRSKLPPCPEPECLISNRLDIYSDSGNISVPVVVQQID